LQEVYKIIISNSSLAEFYISSNIIGSKAADNIAAVLSCNAVTLDKFCIHSNDLQVESTIKIARGLLYSFSQQYLVFLATILVVKQQVTLQLFYVIIFICNNST